MSAEKNKAIVRRWSEALNKGNLAALDKLVAPDYVDHTEKLRGPEELKQHYTTLLKGFPDAHVTIKDIIAEGDCDDCKIHFVTATWWQEKRR